MIERKKYLDRLISKKENGLVKVITGIRRCGKSYLLFNIYKEYLIINDNLYIIIEGSFNFLNSIKFSSSSGWLPWL